MNYVINIADVLNKYIEIESAKLSRNRTKIVVNLIHKEAKNVCFKAIMKYYALDKGEWHQYVEFIIGSNIQIGIIPKAKIERELKLVFNPIMTLSYTGRL